jgi:hypothetical protein
MLDARVDGILAERFSPRDHRMWWLAEFQELGGMTPYEALAAGRREAVIEIALGRPGADREIALISREEADQLLAQLGPLPHPGVPPVSWTPDR